MLPVEPCMSQFMGENISPSRDGKSFTDIDCFSFIIPDPVGIRVLSVHLRIRHLPNHDVVTEGQDHLVWYSHRVLLQSTINGAWTDFCFRVAYHILSFGFPLKIII
jgi:hypothetical protein